MVRYPEASTLLQRQRKSPAAQIHLRRCFLFQFTGEQKLILNNCPPLYCFSLGKHKFYLSPNLWISERAMKRSLCSKSVTLCNIMVEELLLLSTGWCKILKVCLSCPWRYERFWCAPFSSLLFKQERHSSLYTNNEILKDNVEKYKQSYILNGLVG